MAELETVKLKLFGEAFRCTVCNHDDFLQKKVILKEPGSNLFNIAGGNEEAVCLVCVQCGYLHHFLPRFTRKVRFTDEPQEEQQDED